MSKDSRSFTKITKAETPVKEVVRKGKDINLWEFPAIIHYYIDPGLYITRFKAVLGLAAIFIFLIPVFVYAQGEEIAKYPSRPITFIDPLPAGTPTDLAHRLISKRAEKYLGQPIVIVNKPGGGTTIGMAAIAAAKPDGYTIGHSSVSGLLLIPHLEKLPYNPIKDFRQILQYSTYNMAVAVKAASPFKTFKELIAYARQNPNKLTYGSLANGIQYLMLEKIAKKELVQFTHIPFKGTPEVETALLGEHILGGAGDFNYSLIEAGQIRYLLMLGKDRSVEFPDVPSLKDLGYSDLPDPWYHGICGPSGIPDEIAKKLEAAYTKAMKEPEFAKELGSLVRYHIVYRNSKDLGDYVAQNYEVFGKLVREIKIAK
jgi:tripartite-type tricarboxylate transporter receptor subunit TctC